MQNKKLSNTRTCTVFVHAWHENVITNNLHNKTTHTAYLQDNEIITESCFHCSKVLPTTVENRQFQ